MCQQRVQFALYDAPYSFCDLSAWDSSHDKGSTYSFTSATVAQKVAVVLLRNADLGAGNDWSSKSGSKKISVLINGIALNSSEDNLLDEFLLEILNDHTLSAKSEGFLLNGIKVFDLTNIGEEAL